MLAVISVMVDLTVVSCPLICPPGGKGREFLPPGSVALLFKPHNMFTVFHRALC